MKKTQAGFPITELLVVVLLVAGAGGWIANIVKLVAMNMDHITGMLLVRAVGIFVVPLGVVMGFIPA
jgi:hypothetical protein